MKLNFVWLRVQHEAKLLCRAHGEMFGQNLPHMGLQKPAKFWNAKVVFRVVHTLKFSQITQRSVEGRALQCAAYCNKLQ